MNDLDSSIRTLDPAPPDLAEAQRRRADALLERIVAQDPGERPAGARTRTRHPWRIAAVGTAAAAVATLAVVLTLLPQGTAAVASWTPEASPVSAADLTVAEAACRDQLGYVDRLDELPVVLSERRGDVVALLFWRADPDTASSCIVDLPVGTTRVGEVVAGTGGSSGPASVPPPNTFMEGAISEFNLGGSVLSMVNGGVGDGVVAITVRAGSVEAEATIADGRFSAWVPGSAFTSDRPPSGEGGPEVLLRYDVTLADGTVIVNATSARP